MLMAGVALNAPNVRLVAEARAVAQEQTPCGGGNFVSRLARSHDGTTAASNHGTGMVQLHCVYAFTNPNNDG
jgi:hypothetical protein